MKNKTRTFIRSFRITIIVLFCLFLAIAGICKAYENTVKTAFGETKSAISLTDSGINILDFEIKW